MMKLAVFLLLAGIATASVLPLVSRQRAIINHQPYHYAPHYGYGYGHGVSARYFDQATYPEFGIYRPVGIHYRRPYHNGLGYGRFGYSRLGYYL